MKDAVERKEAAWREILGTRNEAANNRCVDIYKEEKRKVKRYIYQSKKDINEQFGRKMNQDVDGNMKLFGRK